MIPVWRDRNGTLCHGHVDLLKQTEHNAELLAKVNNCSVKITPGITTSVQTSTKDCRYKPTLVRLNMETVKSVAKGTCLNVTMRDFVQFEARDVLERMVKKKSRNSNQVELLRSIIKRHESVPEVPTRKTEIPAPKFTFEANRGVGDLDLLEQVTFMQHEALRMRLPLFNRVANEPRICKTARYRRRCEVRLRRCDSRIERKLRRDQSRGE